MEKIIIIDETRDLVIPQDIKESLELQKNDKFFIVKNKDAILIKKVKQPPLSKRFKNLSQTTEIKFKDRGITEADVSEAVAWARK